MLRVEGLQKSYQVNDRSVPALQGVSFSARDGEILGILGKSGSGKSTLMKILRGIESFDSGRIICDGLEILPDSPREVYDQQIRITAIHMQREFGLWTESALKNVVRRVFSRVAGYEALPIEEDPDYQKYYDEARYYLGLVGLEGKANHLGTILSGGEKQRLMIARQLAKKPRLLLLDEPATMACPATMQEMLDTILKVNRELGLTTLVVSHLPDIHRYLASRMIWLEDGQVRSEGSPKEILAQFLAGLGPKLPLPVRPEPQPVIQVRDLCKRNYLVGCGEVMNISHLNLDINMGETTALIGSSGAGKTTLLMMIQGLRLPKEGIISYRLNDQWVDITQFSPQRMEVRRSMGIMFQEFALMPNETILEQIAYKLGVKGPDVLDHARSVAREAGISDVVLDAIYTIADMTEDDARASLDKLGLSKEVLRDFFPRLPGDDAARFAQPIFKLLGLDMSVLNKLPEQISGGEKVRASLAILLAANPQILILDEPFGDIDPITLREVANALKRVQQTYGTTILLVSHHVGLVQEVAHRALLLEGGQIVEDGEPAAVCQQFLSRCGARYLQGEIS